MSRIKDLINEFDFSKWKGCLTTDEIKKNTSSKIQKALDKHEIPGSEEILLLIDNSFLGSGKDSIIFTKKRVSISKTKLLGSNELYSFDWSTIKKVEILNGKLIVHKKPFGQDEIPIKDVIGDNHEFAHDFTDLITSIISLDKTEFVKQHQTNTIKWAYFIIPLALILFYGAYKMNLIKSDELDTVFKSIEPTPEVKSISLGHIEHVELGEDLEPIYFALPENDSLKINAEFNYPASLKVYRYKDHQEIFSENDSKNINATIKIPNTDIYYLIIKSDAGNYTSLSVNRIFSNKKSRKFNYTVKIDTVIKDAPFEGAEPSTTLKFTPVFKTPHKATINSAGKKLLTSFGENRVIIPVDLPENTSEWIYRLNLSYRDKSTETSLYDDMNSTWNKVNKSAAIASAFSNPASGIIVGRPITMQNQAYKMLGVGQAVDLATLLYDKLNEVPKEEAYVNYYVISGDDNAKMFLNGDDFDYSLASSQRNIQSTEEIEKKITKGQVYLGLENSNIKEQVYVQLETIAIESFPVFMRLDRKLEKKLSN